MTENANAGRSGPLSEVEVSLDRLEAAITDAGHAVASLRGALPHIEALTEVVRAMETAMNLAQQHLGPSPIRGFEQQPSVLRAEIDREQALRPVAPAGGERAAPAAASHSLILHVGCKTGPLDLKAVDAAVVEQPGVSDVALLDYDGRHATLQIWTADGDPITIGEALLEGLHKRLGGEDTAEVEIEVRAAA